MGRKPNTEQDILKTSLTALNEDKTDYEYVLVGKKFATVLTIMDFHLRALVESSK